MSKGRHNGSHYENQQQAVDSTDRTAHTHTVAATGHGKQDHQTGPEHSREEMEYARQHRQREESSHPPGADRHGIVPFGHEETALLAYRLWQRRGSPHGSPEDDWYRAQQMLRLRQADRPAGARE